MFEGFSEHRIATGESELYVRVGGAGPPLVCLHGFPQTHVIWHRVAPALAEHYTVVLMDLRGYGESSFPASDDTHAAYSKRAMGRDVLAVMRELGYERFLVAGHDRGGRVGYRLALDAPACVAALATLDIVPTLDSFEALRYQGSYQAYHWYFLAQPAPLPERLIAADPDFYLDWTIDSWCARPELIHEQARRLYRASFRRPQAIHAACEDYRAGYSYDMQADARDRDAGRKITCPLLALWADAPANRKPFDYLNVWRRWADDVRGRGLDSGHFLPEEAAAETTEELLRFFDACAAP